MKNIILSLIIPNPDIPNYNYCIIVYKDSQGNKFLLISEKVNSKVTISQIVESCPNIFFRGYNKKVELNFDIESYGGTNFTLIPLEYSPTKLTKAEIEEKLGYLIDIVDGKD